VAAKPHHPPGPSMTLGNMRELGVRSLNIAARAGLVCGSSRS
jgi:hypothetical protein